MARLFVMQTGQTTWQAQGRMESSAGAPLTDEGLDWVCQCVQELSREPIATIYAASGEAEHQTARLLGHTLGVKVKPDQELREFDFGLWQGLTMEDIKRRQPKLYKRWTEQPTTVRPPGGETLQEAQERLGKAAQKVLRRQKGRPALLVLRPVATGLLRSLLEKTPVEELWQNVNSSFRYAGYEVPAEAI